MRYRKRTNFFVTLHSQLQEMQTHIALETRMRPWLSRKIHRYCILRFLIGVRSPWFRLKTLKYQSIILSFMIRCTTYFITSVRQNFSLLTGNAITGSHINSSMSVNDWTCSWFSLIDRNMHMKCTYLFRYANEEPSSHTNLFFVNHTQF